MFERREEPFDERWLDWRPPIPPGRFTCCRRTLTEDVRAD
jgi:hypothetical protein